MKQDRSIRRVLFLHFSSASLIPLLVLLITMTLLLNQNLRSTTVESNQIIAESITWEIRSLLDHIESTGRWLSFHAAAHKDNPGELQALLSNMAAHFTFFESSLIIDKNGIVIATFPFDTDIIGNNLSTQSFYQRASETGEVFWSDTFISPYTNSPTAAAIFPNPETLLIGYIKLDLLKQIGALAASNGSPELVIVDEQGNLLVHPDKQMVLQQHNIFNNQVVMNTLNGRTGTFDTTFEGRKVLCDTALVTPTNWGVLVLQNKSDVFSILYRLLFSLGLLILLAALLSFALAFFSRKHIVRPIYQLMKSTQEIADGKYGNFQLTGRSYREINYLAHTISRMSARIASREEELKKNLMEKEILIKEVHHRVKNNFQLILSILSLKNFSVTDQKTKDVLYDNIGRIYTIAQVHEQLYNSDDLARINISSYLPTLTTYLLSHKKYAHPDVVTDIQVDEIYVRVDQAIPLGLIIFELFSNALQHGFTPGSLKTISVKGNIENDMLQLRMHDTGKSFGPSLFHSAEGLGFNIVHELIRQLKGAISYIPEDGNIFDIEIDIS